jgi:hypothetical protein
MTVSSIFAIAALNFCSISVVKESGAVTRTIVDTLRILGVWMISLVFRWEPFNYVQMIGFVLLVLGNILYNEILPWGKSPQELTLKEKV